ncbi:hypothetical protein [Sulfolobus acidocaldarius]|uniref:Uncharacterized protein n=2 Tax=Sulfolobus acidocaldarius TaxID=2285 RepID=M1J4Q7_9CREN|nr:hypothetical protein [Sulfolobus acidocaldarius]AGE71949.1 hypothetical protein SacN8_09975 [Sulfolobus acidocaldarius N8]AGE74221.1 hypothetical protein SacRon12I_09995 [Sulfolobus acidocaldarius Ron12/I]WCM35809.1 hypothetical protein GO597_10950 [Sulfolobus acidocaldarius DSM 639]
MATVQLRGKPRTDRQCLNYYRVTLFSFPIILNLSLHTYPVYLDDIAIVNPYGRGSLSLSTSPYKGYRPEKVREPFSGLSVYVRKVYKI